MVKDPGVEALERVSRLERLLELPGSLVTVPSLEAYFAARPPGRNLFRNARGRVNQRGNGSGTYATGVYILDGWKATISGTIITMTGDENTGRTITIDRATSVGQYTQDVERRDVIPGDYLVVWAGTARMRVHNVGAAASSYVAADPSGVTVSPVTLDGTDAVRVTFANTAAGTPQSLEWAALIRADEWSGFFPDISYAEDLRWCQRFYYRTPALVAANGPFLSPLGLYVSTTVCVFGVPVPVTMRAVPTLGSSTVGNFRVRDSTGNDRTASAIALGSNQAVGTPFITVEVTTGSTTAGSTGFLRASASGAYLEFSTEL